LPYVPSPTLAVGSIKHHASTRELTLQRRARFPHARVPSFLVRTELFVLAAQRHGDGHGPF
jgi:hypothetical protein